MSHLKLRNLQSVVQRVVEEEKVLYALKEEIAKTIGSSVITENRDVGAICDDVMQHLDVIEARNGRPNPFKPALTIKMLEHASPRVRRLGARLAPASQLHKVMNDKSSYVRAEVAKRVSLAELKTMTRQFPNDDAIAYIYEARLNEGTDEEFDMYGEDRLGDSVKQCNEQELTDMWYESLARKLVEDYRHETETGWVSTAVNNYVRAVKTTSGIEIDAEKLRESIYEIINEHDDAILSSMSLKETYQRLLADDLMESTTYTMGADDDDIVTDLVNSRFAPTEYLNQAAEVFSVQEGAVSRGVRRLVLTEGVSADIQVPVSGELPHDMGFRSIDEKALDLYCESWNKKRLLEGNPLRISWSVDPTTDAGIIFETTMR